MLYPSEVEILNPDSVSDDTWVAYYEYLLVVDEQVAKLREIFEMNDTRAKGINDLM